MLEKVELYAVQQIKTHFLKKSAELTDEQAESMAQAKVKAIDRDSSVLIHKGSGRVANIVYDEMQLLPADIDHKTNAEEDDDALCVELYKQYRNDPGRGEFVSFEVAAEQLGICLNDLLEK